MTTEIEKEESVLEPESTEEIPAVKLEELLEFVRERVEGDMTRCPGCNLLVNIHDRRCQHCESNIEANNALVRETLRHIEEVTGQLDNDGRAVSRAWLSMKNRIRRLFGRSAEIKQVNAPDVTQHVLTGALAGDTLTVVSVHGSWVLVRTSDGREGWVYSLSGS